jgi:hypothetical protein
MSPVTATPADMPQTWPRHPVRRTPIGTPRVPAHVEADRAAWYLRYPRRRYPERADAAA